MNDAKKERKRIRGFKRQVSQAYNKEKTTKAGKGLQYAICNNQDHVLKEYIERYQKTLNTIKGSGIKTKRGGNVVFFNDPNQLLKKLELIVGEILAENTSIKMRNTGTAILDMLLKTATINRPQHEKIYKIISKLYK